MQRDVQREREDEAQAVSLELTSRTHHSFQAHWKAKLDKCTLNQSPKRRITSPSARPVRMAP